MNASLIFNNSRTVKFTTAQSRNYYLFLNYDGKVSGFYSSPYSMTQEPYIISNWVLYGTMPQHAETDKDNLRAIGL